MNVGLAYVVGSAAVGTLRGRVEGAAAAAPGSSDAREALRQLAALAAAGRAAAGWHGAYGGGASVGNPVPARDHAGELPGAPCSKERLAYCMALEATGDRAAAWRAARASGQQLRRCSGLPSASIKVELRGRRPAGRRSGRRGLPARRRRETHHSDACVGQRREAPRRVSGSTHETTSCRRQDSRATPHWEPGEYDSLGRTRASEVGPW